MAPEDILRAMSRIAEMDAREEARHAFDSAHNDIEAFVYKARDQMGEPDFIYVTTEAERASLVQYLENVGMWLSDARSDATLSTYHAKLKELQGVFGPAQFRLKEHRNRPETVAKLMARITAFNAVAESVRNTSTNTEFNETQMLREAETLAATSKKVYDWLMDVMAQQATRKGVEAPAFTTQDVEGKLAYLERELRLFLSRPKPKAKVLPPKENSSQNVTEETGKQPNQNSNQSGSSEFPKPDNVTNETVPQPNSIPTKEEL